jgi:hypothetical protein
MWSHLSILALISWALESCSQSYCLCFKLLPIFQSEFCTRWEIRIFFQFSTSGYPDFQALFVEEVAFSPMCYWHLYWESDGCSCVVGFFCWVFYSIDVYVCFVPVLWKFFCNVFEVNFKSNIVWSFWHCSFLFRIALVIWGPLCLHMNL